MAITKYEDVNIILLSLLTNIQSVFHDNLVGLYLYGSLTSGDFDHDISDIDLLAVTNEDVTNTEIIALKKMHEEIIFGHLKWNQRIEVAYISKTGLRNFKTTRSAIAVISPGESLHKKYAGTDWLINWYSVQEKGVPIFGPNQKTFIPTISKTEYRNAISEQATLWLERVNEYNESSAPGSLAYVAFTMCRLLYGYTKGEQLSKKRAALWVIKEYPEWSSLIQRATIWRNAQWSNNQSKDESAVRDVKKFVHFVTDRVRQARTGK
jgi:predicted nucleotidyltransferase